MNLSELLSLNQEKFLGPGYSTKYPYAGNGLAFLFKVLSVRTALSIQAHPDRETAQRLHAAQPSIYKDQNPKPEVAIALTDDFTACYGFATPETLAANFEASQTPKSIVAEVTDGNFEICEPDNADWLKSFVSGLFNKLQNDQAKLSTVIEGLKTESEAVPSESRSIHQKFCLVMIE